jgi:hypothetical protein
MPTTPDDDLATRETVRLPVQPRARQPGPRGASRRPARRAPLALAASVTTGWAALVSLAPMLVVVALVHAVDPTGASVPGVARLGLATWLLAHGVPLQTGLGTVGLAPLALSAFAAWRVIRAGVHTARAIGARRGPSPWPAVAAGGAVGVVYGAIGALAAVIASGGGVSVSVPRAVVTLAGFGAVAGVAGALVEARMLVRLAAKTPAVVRDGARAGAVAALLILGAGAAVAGMAVAVKGGDASQILDDYRTGLSGEAGLTLVCLLFAPNVAIWAASYLVGPGFAIGTATSISAAEVRLGPLPAVPVLAGLPTSPAAGWGSLLLGLPVAAALVAGWLLTRRVMRAQPETPLSSLVGAAALAGPVAGVLLGLVSLTASGSLGDGVLADVGPRAGYVVLMSAVVVTVGAVLSAVATKMLVGVRTRAR